MTKKSKYEQYLKLQSSSSNGSGINENNNGENMEILIKKAVDNRYID